MFCAVPLERVVPMPRREPSSKPLARWLRTSRVSRGLTIRELAALAGISHPRISQIEGGDTATRDMIERLARALSPEGADEHTARALLNAGLKASGFAGLDDEITYIPNPAERTLLERYSNSDEAGRRLIDETAEMAAERAALRASRAGAIGGRAGD